MVVTSDSSLRSLPLPPKNPLPLRQQIRAVRQAHTGCQVLRDAGGPVTRLALAPRWLVPPVVVVTSPRGGHDMLSPSAAVMERVSAHAEMRALLGDNLFDVPHDEWLPMRRALQPLFTKKHVATFAGHMAEAAETTVGRWSEDVVIDLDAQCRKLTLRALGRSVLGVDLDERAEHIAGSLNTALAYIADRSGSPVRAPRWLPTPARHRARRAAGVLRELTEEILEECRRDPTRDAPLVRGLMEASDPDTGQRLSDNEIRDQLIIFMVAGHDTTATTLTYALWQLGRKPDLQARVVDEVAALGQRELTAEDVAALPYTVAVVREALRLCPPSPALGRTATRDIEIDGYRVPAGSLVLYGTAAVQRDPSLWERADEFEPDRFLGDAAKNRDRWQYAPFGAGPRTCIGDHFAVLEATLALTTILRRVEMASIGDEFPVEFPFTMVAAGPVRAAIHRR
jgi:cytochrome P450